jgi:hypothetical protein
MATLWTLIEVSFSDARRADELLASPASRRELRLDSDPLAGFAMGSHPDKAAAGVRYAGADRRRLGDPQGQAAA